MPQERLSYQAPLPPDVSDYLSLSRAYDPYHDIPERQSVIDFIEPRLHTYYDLMHEVPYVRQRAHHRISSGFFIKFAQKEGYIPSLTDFFQHGIRPTSLLFRFVADYSIRYYDFLRTKRNYPISISGTNKTIPYNVDLRGENPDEAAIHIITDAQNTLLGLTESGSTPVYLGAYPDNKCDSCVHGFHCYRDMVTVPHPKPTDANGGHAAFDPDDAILLPDYLAHTPTATVIETYPISLFLQKEEKDLLTASFPQQDHIPVMVQTTLQAYRRYLWENYPSWDQERRYRELKEHIVSAKTILYNRLQSGITKITHSLL